MRKYNLHLLAIITSFIFYPIGMGYAKDDHHDHQEDHDEHDDHEDHDEAAKITLTLEEQSLGEIHTQLIGTKTFTKGIAVIGRVAQDPEQTAYIAPNDSIVIHSCSAAIGAMVKKGDVLCSGINNADETKEVMSSMEGVILAQLVNIGDKADAVTPIFVVANLDDVGVNFDVYEQNASHVSLGQKVLVYSHAFPEKKFSGKIVFVSPRIDPERNVLRIKVLVKNDEQKLKLGMNVQGDILDNTMLPDHFSVPAEAIQTIDGESVVFIKLDEQTFEARDVLVITQDKNSAAISGDIEVDEAIVVKGSFILKSQMLASEMEHAHSH